MARETLHAARRAAAGLLATTAALTLTLATAGPAAASIPPPQPFQIGVGEHPRLIVDDAGTAHVTFGSYDSGNGAASQPDGVHYCRFKRGASACDSGIPSVYRPKNPAHPTDATTESGGPSIVQVGPNIGIITRRSGSAWPTPGGSTVTSYEATLLYTSSTGGSSFTGPGLVGITDPSGNAVSFGSPASPTIGTISDGNSSGTLFHGISGGTYSEAQANLGDHGNKAWYDGTLAVVGSGAGSVPVAAFKDGGGGDGPDHVQIRSWTGTGDVNAIANWTQPLSVPGYDVQLVGGPGGLFIRQRIDTSPEVFVRSVNPPTKTFAGSVGPLIPVTTGDNIRSSTLAEDSGGHLALFWWQPDGIHEATSANGVTWTAPTMFRADSTSSIEDMHAAATADGGGFLTYQINDGHTDGAIMLQGYGTQTSNGKLGLGNLPGSGTVDPGDPTPPPVQQTPPPDETGPPEAGTVLECGRITFGKVVATIENGCYIPGSGKQKAFEETKSPVDVNGLQVIPDPGANVGIDPKAHRIQVTDDDGKPANATVQAGGAGASPVVLWKGPLDTTLGKKDGTNDALFDFSMKTFQAEIKGFPVKDDLPVLLSADGLSVNIPIYLTMPSYLGGVTPKITLTAKNGAGFAQSSFTTPTFSASINGLVSISNVTLKFTGDPESWTGTGSATVPGLGTLNLSVTVGKGTDGKPSFHGHVDYTFPSPGLPFGDTDAYLQTVGADLGFNPTTVGGDLTVGAVPVSGTNILSVEAHFTIKFKGEPVFHADGQAKILGYQFGSAYFDLFSTPAVDAGAEVDVGDEDLGFKASAAFAFSPSDFDAELDAQACAPLFHCVHIGGAHANKKGISLCAAFFSLSTSWNDPIEDLSVGTCDQDEKQLLAACTPKPGDPPLTDKEQFVCLPVIAAAQGARVAPGGRLQVAAPNPGFVTVVPEGANAESITVTTADGVPSPRLIGPDKQPVVLGTDPAGNVVVSQPEQHSATVILHHPKPGAYAIAPVAGTPAFTSAAGAPGYAAPKVRGSVSGKGKRRQMRFAVRDNADGQTIQLVEQAKGVSKVIASSVRGSGTVSFKPAAGPGGRRTIVAQTIRNGLVQYTTTVAHYTAPAPPRVGKVQGLTARVSKGTTVNVGFRSAPAAKSYLVTVTAGGIKQLVLVKAPSHKASVSFQRALKKKSKVSVTVREVGVTGRTGPAANASTTVR
ncbi:MAG: hypothetical protein AAGC46_06860 [Solirubrobacteraceae bacterium]